MTSRVVIPARNGYVHLEAGELVLRPAQPELGLTHALECDFAPEGPSVAS
jgi:putative DNA primase/helicase